MFELMNRKYSKKPVAINPYVDIFKTHCRDIKKVTSFSPNKITTNAAIALAAVQRLPPPDEATRSEAFKALCEVINLYHSLPETSIATQEALKVVLIKLVVDYLEISGFYSLVLEQFIIEPETTNQKMLTDLSQIIDQVRLQKNIENIDDPLWVAHTVFLNFFPDVGKDKKMPIALRIAIETKNIGELLLFLLRQVHTDSKQCCLTYFNQATSQSRSIPIRRIFQKIKGIEPEKIKQYCHTLIKLIFKTFTLEYLELDSKIKTFLEIETSRKRIAVINNKSDGVMGETFLVSEVTKNKTEIRDFFPDLKSAINAMAEISLENMEENNAYTTIESAVNLVEEKFNADREKLVSKLNELDPHVNLALQWPSFQAIWQEHFIPLVEVITTHVDKEVLNPNDPSLVFFPKI